MPFDPNSPFDPTDPAQWWRLQNLPHILVRPSPPPGTPTGNSAGDDGLPDDWFVPEEDGFPNDWFYPGSNTPAPIPATSAAPPPTLQPNPTAANRPPESLDPYHAFWSQMPASRAGAFAWHPPIFLSPDPSTWLPPPTTFPNSPGQFAPAANGPGGIFGGIGRLLAEQASSNDPWHALATMGAAPASTDPMSLAASRLMFGSLANLQPEATPLSAPPGTVARNFVGGTANLPSVSGDLHESVGPLSGATNQAQSAPPSFAHLSWTSTPTDAPSAGNYLRVNGLDGDLSTAPHFARDPSNRGDLIGDASARAPAPSIPLGNTSPEPDPVRTAQADAPGSLATLSPVLRSMVTAGHLTEEEAAILQQRANALGVARGEKIEAAVRARQAASSPGLPGESISSPQPSSAPNASGPAAQIPKAIGEEPGSAKTAGASEESNPIDTSGLEDYLTGLFKKIGPGPFAPPNGGVRLARPYGRPRVAERTQNNANGAKYGCHTCGTRDFETDSGNPNLDHQPAQSLNRSPGASSQGYPHCFWCSSEQGTLVWQLLRALGVL
jgi:hypothetical protein